MLHFKLLLLVEKAEAVQVRFTLRLRGPSESVNARWMQSLHGFLRGIYWIMFHGHLDYFHKPPLEGRPSTKPGDHATPNAHNHWFILFYHVWGPTWIEIHWNSIWLRVWSHIPSHYTWGSATTLHEFGGVLGTAFGHFLLGSHNSMVTAYDRENRQLVTDEPVEFEKQPVEVQTFRKMTDHFRGSYRIYPKGKPEDVNIKSVGHSDQGYFWA